MARKIDASTRVLAPQGDAIILTGLWRTHIRGSRARRGELLQAPERLQRRVGVAERQAGAPEHEQRRGQLRVVRVLGGEALQRPARDAVETVGERALADEPEPLGLVERVRGHGRECRHQHEEDRRHARQPAHHVDKSS